MLMTAVVTLASQRVFNASLTTSNAAVKITCKAPNTSSLISLNSVGIVLATLTISPKFDVPLDSNDVTGSTALTTGVSNFKAVEISSAKAVIASSAAVKKGIRPERFVPDRRLVIPAIPPTASSPGAPGRFPIGKLPIGFDPPPPMGKSSPVPGTLADLSQHPCLLSELLI